MTNIRSTKVGILWDGININAAVLQCTFQGTEEVVESGSVTHCHVINLVLRFFMSSGSEKIDLHDVFDEAKIPAGFTVAVDAHGLALDHRRRPFGDHRRVGAVGVLAGSEHIEVAQADGLEAVGAGEHAGVQLVDVLGDRVGRERIADLVFHLGQVRVVAVGGAGGGVGEAAHFLVLGRHQHVQEAVDIGLVGGDGVGDGSGYRAQGGLVQYMVGAAYRQAAGVQVTDIAFDKAESLPGVLAYVFPHLIQVVLVAGGEVVQADHGLAQAQQGFQKVGADKAGHAGDQPGFGVGFQVGLALFVAGWHGLWGSWCGERCGIGVEAMRQDQSRSDDRSYGVLV